MNPGAPNGFRPQAYPQGYPPAAYGFDYAKLGFPQANQHPYYPPQPYGAPPAFYPPEPNLSPYFQGHPYPSAPVVDPFGYPVHAPPFQP